MFITIWVLQKKAQIFIWNKQFAQQVYNLLDKTTKGTIYFWDQKDGQGNSFLNSFKKITPILTGPQ